MTDKASIAAEIAQVASDSTDAMVRAQARATEVDQDWGGEATSYLFEDGSVLKVSGQEFEEVQPLGTVPSVQISTTSDIIIDGKHTGLKVVQKDFGTVVYTPEGLGRPYQKHVLPHARYMLSSDGRPNPGVASLNQFAVDVTALLAGLRDRDPVRSCGYLVWIESQGGRAITNPDRAGHRLGDCTNGRIVIFVGSQESADRIARAINAELPSRLTFAGLLEGSTTPPQAETPPWRATVLLADGTVGVVDTVSPGDLEGHEVTVRLQDRNEMTIHKVGLVVDILQIATLGE